MSVIEQLFTYSSPACYRLIFFLGRGGNLEIQLERNSFQNEGYMVPSLLVKLSSNDRAIYLMWFFVTILRSSSSTRFKMPSNEIHCESKCKVKKEDYRGIEEKDDKQAHKKNVTQVHHKQKVSSVSLQFFFWWHISLLLFLCPLHLAELSLTID